MSATGDVVKVVRILFTIHSNQQNNLMNITNSYGVHVLRWYIRMSLAIIQEIKATLRLSRDCIMLTHSGKNDFQQVVQPHNY